MKVEFIRCILHTDNDFSLPIVPLANMDAILQDTLGIAVAGRAMEQVAQESAYFQHLDLYVDRKRHVGTERWLQVCTMCFVATVQHLSLWNCKTARPEPACHSDTDTCRDARNH